MEPFQRSADEPYLTLQGWSDMTAGFTTRQAGNLALHVGDDAAQVLVNRHRLLDQLGRSASEWVCAEQVHGNAVAIVTHSEAGRGFAARSDALPDADVLIANEPDLLLAMFYADCVPLYFHDPVSGSFGLAHAGWKGTVANVAGAAVAALQHQYGADPAHICAAIGPSIGSCCYEVDEAVIQHVRPLLDGSSHAGKDLDEQILIPSGEDRMKLDLKLLNRQLMIKAGILPTRIELSSICTGCQQSLMFSHRMEQGNTGRMISFMGKKSG